MAQAAVTRPYGKIADAFVKRVLSGKFPCGKLFRAAVERDVAERKKPPRGYEFKAAAADRACEFIESLPLPGEGPKRGTPFILEDWQVWLVRAFYGWRGLDGYRRWRFCLIWLPKGNGKSPLAAAFAVYTLESDAGAKVYSAATSQAQARMCWEAAQDMLRLDPELADALELRAGEHNIKGTSDARLYEPVSAESKTIEGKRPTLGILDELHLAADNKLFANFKSACDKVDGSTLLTISTAGFGTDTTAPGLKYYNRAAAILRGEVSEPETFALIASADEDDDPFAEATWRKANPNLGVSVSLAGLRAAAALAKNDPEARGTFLTKHLNLWQQSIKQWLPPGRLDACAEDLKLEDFAGRRCFIGLDLGRTRDLTAAALLFPEGDGRYTLFMRAYVTSEMERSHEMYARWIEEGRLLVTPGDAVDFGAVEADILGDAERFEVEELDYDPTFAAYLATRLAERGVTVVPIPTRREHISPAMNELERLVLTKAIRYPRGDTMLPWFFSNVQADVDRGGRPFPVKETPDSPKKIDGAVAAMTALARAMNADPASPYSSGEAVFTWA
ncbi:MAG: hypothetical protein RJA59_677 [Pseudomonadota bacterium]